MKKNNIPFRSKSESLFVKKGVMQKINKQFVLDSYLDKNESPMNIAKHLNVHRSSIRRFLINKNIKMRNAQQGNLLRRNKLNFTSDTKEIGYMLGVFYGDGNIDDGTMALNVKDIEFINRFKKISKKLKLKCSENYYRNGMIRVKISSRNLTELLMSLKFESLNFAQKIEFVNGFFDSEGSVHFKAGTPLNHTQRCISCYNTEKIIIFKIKKFLEHKLGIYSNNSVKMHFDNGHFGTKPVYKLTICDKNSQKIFCDTFKLFGRKQKKLNMIRRCIH